MSYFEAEEKMLREQFLKAEPGSKEQETISEQLVKFKELELKEIKDNASFEEMSAKLDAMERENELKEKEAKLDRRFRWAQLGITAGTTALALAFKHFWTGKWFVYEETGSINGRTPQAMNSVDRMFDIKK